MGLIWITSSVFYRVIRLLNLVWWKFMRKEQEQRCKISVKHLHAVASHVCLVCSSPTIFSISFIQSPIVHANGSKTDSKYKDKTIRISSLPGIYFSLWLWEVEAVQTSGSGQYCSTFQMKHKIISTTWHGKVRMFSYSLLLASFVAVLLHQKQHFAFAVVKFVLFVLILLIMQLLLQEFKIMESSTKSK